MNEISDKKKLTIIIPTYNRSSYLKNLLDVLLEEIGDREDEIDVIVGDNASLDDTAQVLSYYSRFQFIRIFRHATNVGADENFCRCIEACRTEFFWIIGDDDIPAVGVVSYVLSTLEKYSPNLVYLGSKWHPDVGKLSRESDLDVLPLIMKPHDFLVMVNIWFTFISGIVVNKKVFLRVGGNIRKYTGTGLVQLGWIFPLLKCDGVFAYVDEPFILASEGNTGGYSVLKVFGVNFPRIVDLEFGDIPRVRNGLLNRFLLSFFSVLVWKLRFKTAGNFEKEIPILEMDDAFSRLAFYKILIRPILTCGKPVAFLFVGASRFLSKFLYR